MIAHILSFLFAVSFFVPAVLFSPGEGVAAVNYNGFGIFWYCLTSSFWFFFGIMALLSLGNIFMIAAIAGAIKGLTPGRWVKIGLTAQCLLALITLAGGVKFFGYYLWYGSQIGMCVLLWKQSFKGHKL